MPGPRVCSERDRCDKGRTCVLGRCRKDKTMPISSQAPRLEFEPEDLLWLDGDVALGPDDIGDRIVLGKAGAGGAKLLMRFSVSLPAAGRLQRALLILDPLPQCARRPGRIAVEVAHVLSPWESSQPKAGDPPRLSLPMRAGESPVTPPRPLRLDITEIVKAWAEHRTRYHGLALMASGDSPTGACFTTGVTWGTGPRLHIYMWPEPPDAGADAADGSADAGKDAGVSSRWDAGGDW
jgi:hypothetical protein